MPALIELLPLVVGFPDPVCQLGLTGQGREEVISVRTMADGHWCGRLCYKPVLASSARHEYLSRCLFVDERLIFLAMKRSRTLKLNDVVGVCPLSGVHFAGLSLVLCIRRSFLLYILCKSLRLTLRTKLSCSTTPCTRCPAGWSRAR